MSQRCGDLSCEIGVMKARVLVRLRETMPRACCWLWGAGGLSVHGGAGGRGLASGGWLAGEGASGDTVLPPASVERQAALGRGAPGSSCKALLPLLETEVSPLTTHSLLSELGVCSVTVCVHGVSWAQPTAAAAELLQSCLTLCDPIDGSPPGSTVPGIL